MNGVRKVESIYNHRRHVSGGPARTLEKKKKPPRKEGKILRGGLAVREKVGNGTDRWVWGGQKIWTNSRAVQSIKGLGERKKRLEPRCSGSGEVNTVNDFDSARKCQACEKMKKIGSNRRIVKKGEEVLTGNLEKKKSSKKGKAVEEKREGGIRSAVARRVECARESEKNGTVKPYPEKGED